FAPDGRTIVYSADWDKQARGVYVTSLDSLEYRLLGFPGADLLGVSKSGDVAVLNESAILGGNSYIRVGTLAKGSMTGGVSRAELEGVTFADFGSDGAMAVVRNLGPRNTLEYPVGHVLFEGEVTGFRRAVVTPRVSPSGEYVAFFDTHLPAANVVKIVTKAGKLVAESRPFSEWWSLAWTPANELWFAATETSGSQAAIFSLDLSGKERIVWRAPGSITLHDISPQGDVLVSFDRGSSRAEVVEGPGAAPVDRSWREAGRLAALSNNHALLINGVGDSAGPKGSVYAWLPGETQAVRIADGTGVALSPDGKKAIVTAKGTPLEAWVVPTGAGQASPLDVGSVDVLNWAGWLPDGRIVVQTSRKGEPVTVSLVPAEGGAATRLLPLGTTLGSPGPNLISPNGSLIAAVDDQSRIVVCMIGTPAICHQVPGADGRDTVAGWTGDGKSLVVWHGEVGTAQIDHLDITTGRRIPHRTLRPIDAALSGIGKVIAAPDGAIAYYYDRDASQLYVIKGLK
ncbi:MAG TPA: WD40 repeat domain-containing protein, partial [Vicinamibacterales bacterium]|nr:WD40 repeat domain-containing protein [Vicinamibacterales bacterium]